MLPKLLPPPKKTTTTASVSTRTYTPPRMHSANAIVRTHTHINHQGNTTLQIAYLSHSTLSHINRAQAVATHSGRAPPALPEAGIGDGRRLFGPVALAPMWSSAQETPWPTASPPPLPFGISEWPVPRQRDWGGKGPKERGVARVRLWGLPSRHHSEESSRLRHTQTHTQLHKAKETPIWLFTTFPPRGKF